MGQYAENAFARLSFGRSVTQRRPQPSFVARDRTFDLPPLTEPAAVLDRFHLTSIGRLWPAAAGAASIQSNHGRANAQLFPTQRMIMLGIVTGVSQQSMNPHMLARLDHGRTKFGRILAGTLGHDGGREQVSPRVADERQLGPMHPQKPAITAAQDIMSRGVARFQPSGVDGRFGPPVHQAQLRGALPDALQKFGKRPFFWSRCSAYQSVEWSGTSSSSPKTSRNSLKSVTNVTIPR